MNLAHFLQNLEKAFPGILNKEGFTVPYLMGPRLDNPIFLNTIRQLDEFKDCDSVEATHFPVGDGWQTKTILITEGFKFTGDVKLYSIDLTPSVFSMEDMTTPVKDGCLVTPLMYDNVTFCPYKSIVIRVQDCESITFAELFKDKNKTDLLHRKLESIMNDHENYESKGHKGILVRAAFKYVEDKTLVGKPLEVYL